MPVIQFNVREALSRIDSNNARINEIADVVEREQRDRTEQEEAEYRTLLRENEIDTMRIRAYANPAQSAETEDELVTRIREAVQGNRSTAIAITRRDFTPVSTTSLANTGIIPTQQGQMIKPLRDAIIYDKLGLPLQYGLVGELRWPKHTKVTATIADELAAVSPSQIDFDALNAKPERLAVGSEASRESILQSEGMVESIIREELPAAIADLVNAIMLSTDNTKKLYGPFATTGIQTVEFAGDVPTYRELLQMKGKVAAANVKMLVPCFTMQESMKCELEATPLDAGSGRFICENDRIAGFPVITSQACPAGAVGFGDWSYQAAGFFHSFELLVDPYTEAGKNKVKFWLNAHYATGTLLKEAFVLGKKKV